MVGYIHLWRRLLKKPIWLKSTPEQRSVLIAILLMANFYENEWEWQGEKFQVTPGQFITSLESIRKKSGQGISIQNVRSSLKRFEKLEFLTNKSTKQGRLISIINWEDYQASNSDTQHSTQQRPNKGATKTQHLSNNDKNDKNKRKINRKKKIFIQPYLGEFKNVKLTDSELKELRTKFPDSSESKIEDLSCYIDSKGDKYKSHYSTILMWDRKNMKETKGKSGALQPTTYAQAQDAERRGRAKWLKGEIGNDNQGNSGQGNRKTIPVLPIDKIQQ